MGTKQYDFADITPAAASGDFLGKVGAGIRNGACFLYKNSPGALVSNPISDAIHGLWDSFCDYPDSPGLPPPPSPPFTGGQCAGLRYRMYNTLYTYNNNDPYRPQYETYTDESDIIPSGFGGYYGPITGYYWVPTSPYNDGTGRVAGHWEVLANGLKMVLRRAIYYEFARDGVPAKNWDYKVLGIRPVRLPNVPDTCGNPPISFPPAPFPGNPDYTFPVTINYNDGTDNTFTVNFKPPGGGIGINPNFNLIIEDLNLNINLDLGGVTINFPGDGGGADLDELNRKIDDLQNDVDTIKTKQDDFKTDFDDFKTDFDDFNTDFDDFNNRYDFDVDPPPPRSNDPDSDYDFEEEEDKESGDKEQIDNLEWVIIDLTDYPSNIKKQFGGFGAPNVLYAGWIQFKVDNRNLPREPVHFAKNIYKAPGGVNGYAYTLYIGVQATVTTITKKNDPL